MISYVIVSSQGLTECAPNANFEMLEPNESRP
jgi:hypothetical protein